MGKKILIVLTSVDKYPDGSPTGWYLPEAVHPYYAFLESGMDVEFCSISGVATCDPSSIEASKEDAACMKFWNDEKLKGLTLVSKKLADCDISAYDSIFFAGGFGVMWDFPKDPAVIAAIKTAYTAGKPVAAVCHGPICFINVEVDGVSIIKDKEVTGFTNAEEGVMNKYEAVSQPSGPGSCEDAMTAAGAKFKDGGVFQSNVCVAGNILTGQNPPSAGPLAMKLIEVLK